MSKLIYKKWADNRNEVLPVGNGRIGGMIYGNPLDEIISLNEETLWTGAPEKNIEPYDMSVIKEAQKLIEENRFDLADDFLNKNFMRGVRTQTYLPLGKLILSLNHNRIIKASDYERSLDLKKGVYSSESKIITRGALNDHEAYMVTKRECFSSLSDDVLVYNLKSDTPITASLFLELKLQSDITYENGMIYAEGRCPTAFNECNKENILPLDEDKESIPFSVKVGCISDGGIACQGRSVVLYNVTDATIILSVATGFNGYDKMPISQGKDYKKICDDKLKAALALSYEQLRERHIKKYTEQFSRSEIIIDGEDKSNIPTDERIERIKNGEKDPSFATLLFDYGKYLMISSSQPGGQPSNLQGIWNEDLLAPWNCNYTLNINTQMNYWAAEAMNLPECHLPLLEMTKELSKKENLYGLKGWAATHNTDIWRFNRMATRYAQYGLWEVGGVWLARHIYDHFNYTGDTEFLKEYIDVLRGIYDFLEGRLIENKNGKLVLSPSTSPETKYLWNGKKGSVSGDTAMDTQIIYDYLECMEKIEEILGEDYSKYKAMKEKLSDVKISSDGLIEEYGEGLEVTDEPHQHISHLYGIYPGSSIKENTPQYEAAKKTLDERTNKGGARNGWANIWTGICYAKFKDGENALKRVNFMIDDTIYSNMFNFCPPFQIDGNLGICALIIEMLVQGDSENFTLLPALPSEWKSGKVKGIKLPGGKTVSFSWKDNTPYDIEVI